MRLSMRSSLRRVAAASRVRSLARSLLRSPSLAVPLFWRGLDSEVEPFGSFVLSSEFWFWFWLCADIGAMPRHRHTISADQAAAQHRRWQEDRRFATDCAARKRGRCKGAIIRP